MLCESSNLDKLSGLTGSGGGGCEKSSNTSLSRSNETTNLTPIGIVENEAQTQVERISLFRNKGRLHPNIHHRPTIHPKDHYQRPSHLINKLNENSNSTKSDNINDVNNANDEEDKSSQNESTSVNSSNYHSEDHENDEYANMFDDSNVVRLFWFLT